MLVSFRRHWVRCALSAAIAAAAASPLHAATPVVVQNEAGFEGLEEASVLYYPDSNTFVTDSPNFPNHVDEGGGLFRDLLRNNYVPGVGGWWDGDRDTTNTDRQRTEAKGIVGLGHQQVEQTFEYSFDFRTSPTFQATSLFDHIFQLKATNGDDSPPLATISLYKSGSGIQGRVDCFSDGLSGTPQTETIPTTFSYTAGQWIHFVIRITPCAQGESTGGVQLSVNGGAFAGVTNAAIDLQNSTDYRPKFGFYRGISTTAGVPLGTSWVEHRTITGYIGSSNVLTWKGGLNANTWDTTTSNFLNNTTASTFNTDDQVNFTDTSANTTITLAGNVAPNYTHVNATANYTFTGPGALTGGTLRKDGTGTLTLATTNSYPGLTDIRAGTLFVTGSIGNNSLISLTGGTLKLGSASALGSSNANGVQIAGGTLDINGFAAGSNPISVQGTGLSNAGAIINSGANQTSAFPALTLTGDTTLGGTGRWDVRGSSASLSTGGSAFNLTKTGANQISFVGANVDAALANITISQGILAFQTSTSSMGDPAKTVSIPAAGTLDFFNTTATMTKVVSLNGGTIWAESGNTTQNNFSGPITLTSAGGTLDAGSGLTGGTPKPATYLTLSGTITSPANGSPLAKNGPGTVTLSNVSNSLAAPLSINAGTLILTAPTKLNTLTLASGATLTINSLIVQTTPATVATVQATLQNQITTGAITPGTTLPANVTLALLDNATLHKTTFAGLPVDANSLLLAPELLGDANADGTVDLNDLNTVLNHLGFATPNWTAGNFDNATTIDLNDLNTILNNLGTSYANINAMEPLQPTAAPTPEPASLAVAIGVLALANVGRSPHRRRVSRPLWRVFTPCRR